MTRDQVKEVLDRVLSWPDDRQDEAVELLLGLEERSASFGLSDADLAEIERRRANPNPIKLTLEEIKVRLRRYGA